MKLKKIMLLAAMVALPSVGFSVEENHSENNDKTYTKDEVLQQLNNGKGTVICNLSEPKTVLNTKKNVVYIREIVGHGRKNIAAGNTLKEINAALGRNEDRIAEQEVFDILGNKINNNCSKSNVELKEYLSIKTFCHIDISIMISQINQYQEDKKSGNTKAILFEVTDYKDVENIAGKYRKKSFKNIAATTKEQDQYLKKLFGNFVYGIYCTQLSRPISEEKNDKTNALTADDIINNYIKNSGGYENWKKLKAVKRNGSVAVMGKTASYEAFHSEKKMYTKFNYNGRDIKNNVFNGVTLWSINFETLMPEKNKNINDVKNAKNRLKELPNLFLDYKEKGFKAELMGKKSIEGSDAYLIKLTKKPFLINGNENKNISKYYFDAKTFLPIKMTEKFIFGNLRGKTFEFKMGNYKKVDRLHMPFSLIQTIIDMPEAAPVTITLDLIKSNPSIDDSEFEFPTASGQGL
jgi:hypothetical protein